MKYITPKQIYTTSPPVVKSSFHGAEADQRFEFAERFLFPFALEPPDLIFNELRRGEAFDQPAFDVKENVIAETRVGAGDDAFAVDQQYQFGAALKAESGARRPAAGEHQVKLRLVGGERLAVVKKAERFAHADAVAVKIDDRAVLKFVVIDGETFRSLCLGGGSDGQDQ